MTGDAFLEEILGATSSGVPTPPPPAAPRPAPSSTEPLTAPRDAFFVLARPRTGPPARTWVSASPTAGEEWADYARVALRAARKIVTAPFRWGWWGFKLQFNPRFWLYMFGIGFAVNLFLLLID